MRILVDLDQTLVDTKNLQPYMRNNGGINYVALHARNIPTQIIDHNFVEFCHQNNAIVYTNSSARVAKAVLQKHGIKLNVYGNSNKPSKKKLEELLANERIDPTQCLIIGDSPLDTLAGHSSGIGTLIFNPATEFNPEQISLSEPMSVLGNFNDIKRYYNMHKNGFLKYAKRRRQEELNFFQTDPSLRINIANIVDYHPMNQFNHDPSKQILNFKLIRQITEEELMGGEKNRYFWNGQLRSNVTYKSLCKRYMLRLMHEISDLKLQGSTLVVAAPNSLPHYCYKTDINHKMAKNMNRELGNKNYDDRILERFYPSEPKHLHGIITPFYRSVGIRKDADLNYNNIVLFDDVSTSGGTLNNCANLLRKSGFNGRIEGLVLGKTI